MMPRKPTSTFLFLALSVALVGYFVYGFIAWNVVISLSDWRGLNPSYNIIGLDHYARLLEDPVFWTSLRNNALLVLLFVPGSILLGLLLAILLDVEAKREGTFRTIYLLPFALSYVITGTLWAWMYNPSIGVTNTLLARLGLGFLSSGWTADSGVAMYAVILALIWQFSGYAILVFLAGIKSIPESQVMAAMVDGASTFQLYRRVVIPQLKASTFTAFVVLIVFALKAFDFIFVLTGGGPGYATYVLPLMMYRETFAITQFAYGASIATVLFILVMIIIIPYLYRTFWRGGK